MLRLADHVASARAAAGPSVRRRARQSARNHAVTVQEHIRRSDIASDEHRDARANLERHARVAIHFHPDRPNATGLTVA